MVSKTNPRIAHIITDLNGFGGTEATLMRYLKRSRIPKKCHKVIVLKSIGAGNVLGAQIQSAGFDIVELNIRSSLTLIKGIVFLIKILREFKPDILSGWLYHPSLIASLVANFISITPKVVWHIRSLTFSSLFKTPNRYLVQQGLAFVSRFANPLIISNSDEALLQHVKIGFKFRKRSPIIVFNGVDVSEYFPDENDRVALRKEFGIPSGSIVIGSIGRFVPEKGYDVLFDALRIVKSKISSDIFNRIHLVIAGQNVTFSNPSFSSILKNCCAQEKTHLLGPRADANRILRCFDLFLLPSISEAFPNALIEAMATELPCIATDVGQSADALGDSEYLIPPNSPTQLAESICKLIVLESSIRKAIGKKCRERIINNYSINRMVFDFDQIFANESEG